jgi:hypothetical protein
MEFQRFFRSLDKENQNWIRSCLDIINVDYNRASWIISNTKINLTITALKLLCPMIQVKITPELRDASEVIFEWNKGELKLYN